MIKLKEVRDWIDTLPKEFLEFDVVNAEEGILTEVEARLLLGCLIRTNASGEMLDVGERVEEIIKGQLNKDESNN